jgi:hypothetical protein
VWIDNTLDITMIVQGIIAAGPSKGQVNVTCRHGENEWPDAMPVECFITELRRVS